MSENMELAFWVLGIAAIGLLGFLANLLYRAWENKRTNDWDARKDSYGGR